MAKNRWKLEYIQDEYAVKSLADSLNISEILTRLLILRNIRNFTQAKSFFRPSIDSLHNPFLMDIYCSTLSKWLG